MHFTREPIIETIISARAGGELVLRSFGHDAIEFRATTIEVIQLGTIIFYRSSDMYNDFLLSSQSHSLFETRSSSGGGLKMASPQGYHHSPSHSHKRNAEKNRPQETFNVENSTEESSDASSHQSGSHNNKPYHKRKRSPRKSIPKQQVSQEDGHESHMEENVNKNQES